MNEHDVERFGVVCFKTLDDEQNTTPIHLPSDEKVLAKELSAREQHELTFRIPNPVMSKRTTTKSLL